MSYPNNYVLIFLEKRLVFEERQYDTYTQSQLFKKLFDTLTYIYHIYVYSHAIKFPLFT